MGSRPLRSYRPSTFRGADGFNHTRAKHRRARALQIVLQWACIALALVMLPAAAGQFSIPGPAGSVNFGTAVAVLPNGNIVVTDPNGGGSGVGAVYLYKQSGALISTLKGSTANDHVGSGGIVVLANGNYVIRSPGWTNGVMGTAGAVTWANASTGIAGTVSMFNSLVGLSAGDLVGSHGVIALANGNYVVVSPNCDNGAATNAGAVTWGNGSSGVSGVVTAANSLVGSTSGDQVGSDGVIALTNGNYVVGSSMWDNGATANVGAATWGNGATGIAGAVSAANSLIGTTANDEVSLGGANPGITPLTNGNYVVRSVYWNNGGLAFAGAATWGDGSSGLVGVVSAANSLVGASGSDQLGNTGVWALNNGNYLVCSPNWNGTVGAATWGNGSTGSVVGAVSPANSLVGSQAGDYVGMYCVALANGNYVIATSMWTNGVISNAGAVTWGNGGSGSFGAVSAANSLVGTTAYDLVGYGNGVVALSNGNYVALSPYWDNGSTANVGAATWGNGATGTTGPVSAANSLVGSTASDQVGAFATALSNGNYVVVSGYWFNGATQGAGAVTWGDGGSGLVGAVSAANSLIGSTLNDGIGFRAYGVSGVVALGNGNYAVASGSWDNGVVTDAGAVSWGNGSSGTTGVVSPANSLVGSSSGDAVGGTAVIAFSDGNYAVRNPLWDNGALVNAGAVTFGTGNGSTIGAISADNSVRGTVASGGASMSVAYDAARVTLVVGQPAANLVTLLSPDLVFKNGFE